MALTGSIAFSSHQQPAYCTSSVESDTVPPINKDRDYMGVYLTKPSQETISKVLASKGVKDASVSFVSFHSSLDDKSSYVYQPLYGQRAAFRLKGIMRSDDPKHKGQIVVGVGRVSTMIGELSEGDFVAAMPVSKPSTSKSNKNEINNNSSSNSSNGNDSSSMVSIGHSLDLPTRLFRVDKQLSSKPFWKGRLPPDTVFGHNYGAELKASYVPLHEDEQVIVDGYICSSSCVDADGQCTKDRETEMVNTSTAATATGAAGAGAGATTVTGTASTTQPSSTQQSGPPIQVTGAEKAECPVCKYMKAGSCKQEFENWESCIDGLKDGEELTKCIEPTVLMMRCTKRDEYYDIMTAGTDYSKIDAIAEHSPNMSANANAHASSAADPSSSSAAPPS